MLPALLSAIVAFGLQALPDSSGPYSAVLSEIREQFPDREIVLTTTLAHPECFPHCEDANFASSLSPEMLAEFEEQGLIVGTCTPEPRTIGCGSTRETWAPDRMVVTLAPPEPTEGGGVALNAVLVWREESRGREIASVRGYLYRLEQGAGGEWCVASSTLVWTV